MNSAIERLLSLRVGDVMTKQVILVSVHQTMAEAAAKFTEHTISGAPVVDEQGHCVGILGASDFVRRAHGGATASSESPTGGEHALVHESPESAFEIESCGEDLVSAHMSPTLQAIPRDATLLQAAREMCALHVHRLPVLDENGHAAGLISSLDIVAALVQAVEE